MAPKLHVDKYIHKVLGDNSHVWIRKTSNCTIVAARSQNWHNNRLYQDTNVEIARWRFGGHFDAAGETLEMSITL